MKDNNKIRRFIRDVDEETGEVLKEYNRKIIDDGLTVIENDNNFTKVYGKELMKYVDTVSASELATITCLLNNIAYETCMLTKTGNNDKRYVLTHNDIEKITSLSHSTIKRNMSGLVRVGLLARVKFKNSYIYYANPYVFLKGNRVSKAIVEIFS